MQPPVMPDDGHTTRLTTGVDVSSSASGKESSVLEPVWDDEDTRAFYESLPDLRLVKTFTSVVYASFQNFYIEFILSEFSVKDTVLIYPCKRLLLFLFL